jgi:hypothetical protein
VLVASSRQTIGNKEELEKVGEKFGEKVDEKFDVNSFGVADKAVALFL